MQAVHQRVVAEKRDRQKDPLPSRRYLPQVMRGWCPPGRGGLDNGVVADPVHRGDEEEGQRVFSVFQAPWALAAAWARRARGRYSEKGMPLSRTQ